MVLKSKEATAQRVTGLAALGDSTLWVTLLSAAVSSQTGFTLEPCPRVTETSQAKSPPKGAQTTVEVAGGPPLQLRGRVLAWPFLPLHTCPSPPFLPSLSLILNSPSRPLGTSVGTAHFLGDTKA